MPPPFKILIEWESRRSNRSEPMASRPITPIQKRESYVKGILAQQSKQFEGPKMIGSVPPSTLPNL
jgi:hypothetical protein